MKDYYREIYNCDCCGRQIVTRKVSDSVTIGPRDAAIRLGSNKHICGECKLDPLLREQEGLDIRY